MDYMYICDHVSLCVQVIAEFGTDHVYNCDTFNEMVPSSGELDYLSAVGHATFQAMIDIDPTAIWWLNLLVYFQGRMLVLDLQSEQHEQYTTYSSYFGQPFIWCMLHNFGGTLGLFGSMSIINQKVFVARALPNGTMVGTGLTPEGINQNYVIYDLMTEMSWRTEPTNLTQWVSAYATRRYGEENDDSNQAWDLLKAWFNVSDVASAWYHLLTASPHLESVPTFQHDLVDVTRQVLQNLGTSLYVIIVDAYRSKNISSFQNNAALMLDLLTDLDNVLSSNRAFLLGTWLESAKALATTPLEAQKYEYNARNQITLWGPNGEIRDYANKQWAGVVINYFRPRWELFLGALHTSLVTGVEFNQTEVNNQIFNVELRFTLDQTIFPHLPKGNSVEIAWQLHQKWGGKLESGPCWEQSWQQEGGPQVALV
uniref:Alpha-N-acetylglucosaminidase n=1 Tax=Timema genevievae TaxID=629358 RepID=A0A7R9PQ30_TIMGE|nr:unnamed protein product [Timema genevievae]